MVKPSIPQHVLNLIFTVAGLLRRLLFRGIAGTFQQRRFAGLHVRGIGRMTKLLLYLLLLSLHQLVNRLRNIVRDRRVRGRPHSPRPILRQINVPKQGTRSTALLRDDARIYLRSAKFPDIL